MSDPLFELPASQQAPASADFKLSITRALADQLAEGLAQLRPAPLGQQQLELLDDRPGVYELFLDRHRVYVGKTNKSLSGRLSNHLRKLSGRVDMDPTRIGFICLYVDEDLDAASPEKLLIKKYKTVDEAPWNTMGFGNKDPGRNRDRTLVKAGHFDAKYPIDLDRTVHDLDLDEQSVGNLLKDVKAKLPYNLRFETKKKIKSELVDTRITVTSAQLSARDIMKLVIAALPAGWQATALPGYLILYRETANYRSATTFWRKSDGGVQEAEGQRLLDADGKIKSDDEVDEDEADDDIDDD